MKDGDGMLRRKTLRPFLICSLIIHGVIVLIMMKIWLEPRQLPAFEPDILID
ncbi:hypothetical protein IH992_21025, partial [Candidatus Poribacteria bacterium]|nr:hypothetical protein [Candidatus Poribacteria bacterium]